MDAPLMLMHASCFLTPLVPTSWLIREAGQAADDHEIRGWIKITRSPLTRAQSLVVCHQLIGSRRDTDSRWDGTAQLVWS
jgi:hypothetical protein